MALHAVLKMGTTVSYTSSTSASVQTITLPKGCIGFYASVRTTNGYIGLDGAAAPATDGHLLPKDNGPQYFPIGGQQVITFVSTSGATAAVLNLSPALG